MSIENSVVSYNQTSSLLQNSLRDSRREDSGLHLSDEDRMKRIKYILNVFRNRNFFMMAKCKKDFNASRSIAGATMIEDDNNMILKDFYEVYDLHTLYGKLFEMATNSSLIWKISNQILPLMNPGQFSKPFMDAAQPQKYRLVTLIDKVGLKSAECLEIEKKYDVELRHLLVAQSHYLETIKIYQNFKEKRQLVNESSEKEKSRKRHEKELMKKRKMIASINKMRCITSNLLTYQPGVSLEDPKIIEIISSSRNRITEDSLKREAKIMFNNLSQMNGS